MENEEEKKDYANEFAQIEYALGNYYNTHIKEKIDGYIEEIEHEKRQRLNELKTSAGYNAAGMYGLAAQSAMAKQHLQMYDTPRNVQELRDTCLNRLKADGDLIQDLTTLTDNWRIVAIKQLGAEKYKELSKSINEDLAVAYINKRVTIHFCSQLAEKEAPKSTLEYIIYKGFNSSLLSEMVVKQGGAGEGDLDREVERLAESKYAPSKTEKTLGGLLGVGIDLLAASSMGLTAAIPSSGSVAASSGICTLPTINASLNTILVTIGVDGLSKQMDTLEEKQWSEALYGDKGMTKQIEQQTNSLKAGDIRIVREINKELKKPLNLPSYQAKYDPSVVENIANSLKTSSKGSASKLLGKIQAAYKESGMFNDSTPLPPTWMNELSEAECFKRSTELCAKAIEMRYNYRDTIEVDGQKLTESQVSSLSIQYAQAASQKESERINKEMKQQREVDNNQAPPKKDNTQQSRKEQNSGWDNLASEFGLKGVSDMTKNMGYVLAMLPDMLINLFTGKSKMALSDNLFPVAMIAIGLFFKKSPFLKMLLVGLGGIGLLNKMTHEQIGNRITQPSRYKTYEDEPLNERIKELAVKGNTLMATIDGSPCVITISDRAMDAYYKGAVPLNTLANAVLERYDANQRDVERSYSNGIRETETESRHVAIK